MAIPTTCPYENLGSPCVLARGHRDENGVQVTHLTENGETHIIYPNKEKTDG